MRPNRGGFQRPVNTDIVNEQLPNGEFLVIDEAGNKLGVFNRQKALEIANDHGLDIFVVSPGSNPMVAKLMDYSKHRYEQQKKLKEMRKNQQVIKIKEVKLSPTIDKHDFNVKLKNAQKFIHQGDKVKVSLRFRGRMIVHKDIGMAQVENFISQLEDIVVESKPKLEGYNLIAIVAPVKK